MKKRIAVLEGDGIGPEIVREGLKVLKVMETKYGHEFFLEFASFGAGAYFAHGDAFPKETKAACDRADAIIKGPVGLPVDQMSKIPQHKRPEIAAILPLRKRYDTFLNYRPVRLPKELASFSPLKPEIIGEGVDIMMIRELVGGIYFGQKVESPATKMMYSIDECKYTDEEVRRVAHAAFREARRRKALLTNVHKANVLATGRFWEFVVENVAKEYPDVEYRSILVDNAAFQLVKNPTQFNGVMLLENMQGDILTDQAGGILGSLGLMPSACMGLKKGYVEPAHGSAPDIANQNKANPYSMIGSIAFLFDECFDLKKEASEIWSAMFEVFGNGYRTVELAGKDTPKNRILSTSEFGDMVVAILTR
ncbi:MAG: 3-isopropylmalate dehydrogenase [Candidatus Auribacter fodinae]|jgi:3-isopropylmalate dehydrogenase|uniref:3-isopropylmalate dehydrogenase n=1 Tax=Candidatus Auribacter fodinae TaxID=2093366 RepID=A0A3A4RFR6_9BACT|nr:MAG: 3-isopropylmalate dehydrogenase [Candidatus Auribacter fodinae]